MGGGSPLLGWTEQQAAALEADLSDLLPAYDAKCFIAMRYWGPRAAQTARAVAAFSPDEIVLLPLYPQYSTTTTHSSIIEWRKTYSGSGRSHCVCCYPTEAGLISAHVRRIEAAWTAAGRPSGVRLLFSAHGLPEKVVQAGDPYQIQVEATAAAIAERLGPQWVDWRVCYQSRVGPMRWLGPSTLESIAEAAGDGLGVVIAPIAFVSEHVETLVELDHDYALQAEKLGCEPYIRVAALGLERDFITGLARQVMDVLDQPGGVHPGSPFACAANLGKCPRNREAAA
jgi:ferrochelatase